MNNTRRNQLNQKCVLWILLFGLSLVCTAQEPKTKEKSAEKSKTTEDWRESEKRFLTLLNAESFEERFDTKFFDGLGAVTFGSKLNKIMDKNGRVLAVQWVPLDQKLAKLTVEQIRQSCGRPHISFDKEEWWGRLGYIIKEDKTMWFQVVRDISLLSKPAK